MLRMLRFVPDIWFFLSASFSLDLTIYLRDIFNRFFFLILDFDDTCHDLSEWSTSSLLEQWHKAELKYQLHYLKWAKKLYVQFVLAIEEMQSKSKCIFHSSIVIFSLIFCLSEFFVFYIIKYSKMPLIWAKHKILKNRSLPIIRIHSSIIFK